MAIQFACPHCSQLMRAKDGSSGASANCIKCGQPVVIPQLALPESTVPPPDSAPLQSFFESLTDSPPQSRSTVPTKSTRQRELASSKPKRIALLLLPLVLVGGLVYYYAYMPPTEGAKKRAQSKIADLLTEAVQDNIHGSSFLGRVANIQFKESAASQFEYNYVGEALDSSGKVVGKVSGTYSFRPESLSATVLYYAGVRAEYGMHYFKTKL